MRSGRITGAVTAAVAAALLAGCGASGPTPQVWTDEMCTAVLPFVRTAVGTPEAGSGTDERLRAISDYLGRTTTALDRTLGDLDRLGPAPVDDGEALTARLAGGLGEVRSAFSGARGRVDALDPADPAAAERDLPAALDPVARLGSATDPLNQVTGDPELAAAFRTSATCGELTRLAGTTPTDPPNGPGVASPNGVDGEGGGR
ncbi:hypothetical protein [Pseudonocardia parietis]|uniref:Uncharacterized protein n=1 Tax=Pseudonocardia parietis TaxID=570936 RepID=A0ABS4VKF8_9PSEU|nr:hypothetical protein [Pseudonocardia parietis]MBP2364408.1 hypothetical protein [Pseudonocardia parietis]